MPMYRIAVVVLAGLVLANCSPRPRNFGPPQGYAASSSYNDEDSYRGEKKCVGTVKTLPSGRKACVEHITDQKFLHQPEFNRVSEKEKRCAGKEGQLVPINLGDGLTGNYRC